LLIITAIYLHLVTLELKCIKISFQNYKREKKKMIPKTEGKIDLLKEQKSLYDRIFNKKDNTWKIMIYDQANNDVISSLFKVKDLRENNITLYFNINQYRDQIQGVTAIYLVKPISENIELIVQDFERDLYSSVILHFTS